MIHIGQLKIPVEKVMAEASKQDLKKGIISAGETAVIKRYIEKKLKIKQSDIRRILSRSYVTNEDREIFNKKGIRLIILYCDKGNQSIVATRDLVKLGYPVVSLNGGFEKYKEIYG